MITSWGQERGVIFCSVFLFAYQREAIKPQLAIPSNGRFVACGVCRLLQISQVHAVDLNRVATAITLCGKQSELGR